MPEKGPAGPVPISKALNCSSCGAALVVRAAGHSLTVVCDNCRSVLDAKDPNFQVLSRFEAKYRITPKIPLGARGKLDGVLYEVIGMQVRTIEVEGVSYSWSEYLLFNPYQGFRYLTEYAGHWNFVRTVRSIPDITIAGFSGVKPVAKLGNATYLGFQRAQAKTTYVLGEFPWQVRVGDSVGVEDHIAPPLMLSSEITEEEVTWSLGEYTAGAEVWQAFKLPGKPPAASGVFANQPSPYAGQSARLWGLWAFFMVAVVVMAGFFMTVSSQEMVFDRDYTFQKAPGERSFVTEPFDLQGRTSNVQLNIRTDLFNNWAYFNFALINEETGQGFDFGREVSYYRDSEGSEGSPNDEVLIPSVPSGRYYLRVEPEVPATSPAFHYELKLRRDVPAFSFFWITAALLALPPIILTWRSMNFEGRRWQESSYAASSGSDSSILSSIIDASTDDS